MEPKAHLLELDNLIGEFFDNPLRLGEFAQRESSDVPDPFGLLLNHDFHMTVTVEKFHSSSVEVLVHRERRDGAVYSREICLRRESDRATVQYGIVRLDLRHLDTEVQDEILGHGKPLGRILIENDVMRRVKLLSLYEVKPSPYLAEILDSKSSQVFGRTAIIYCNDEPAIELLEIVVG